MNLERASANVGHGPARAACLDAVRSFEQGFVLLDSEHYAAWCRAPAGGFQIEGVGAGCVVQGRDLPALTGSHAVLLAIGAGLGHALKAALGHEARPTDRWQANGLGFGQALIRPDATLQRPPPPLPADLLVAWNEGLGRALWYLAAGEPTQLARLARGRDAATWTGIGQASAFTGGADPDVLCVIDQRAGAWQQAFREGARLASHAARDVR